MSIRKTPWMKWFPSDWRSDPLVRSLTPGARSFWLDCIGLMHEADPYGHLVLRGRNPSDEALAAAFGLSVSEVMTWRAEIIEKGVCDVIDGVIVSRRMLRDAKEAERHRLNGGRGGNPRLTSEQALEQFDAAADLATKRMSAAERQRRRRLRLKAENERDMSHDVTRDGVTCHVTVTPKNVTEKRDSVTLRRDSFHGAQGRGGRVTGVNPLDNRGDKAHKPEARGINPSSLNSTQGVGRPAGGSPPAASMGGGDRAGASRRLQPAAPIRTPAEQIEALRQAAAEEAGEGQRQDAEGAASTPARGMGSGRPNEPHPAPPNARQRASVKRPSTQERAAAQAATLALLAETVGATRRSRDPPADPDPVPPIPATSKP